MATIDIRGILVGPEYDDPIFAADIERGVLCPSSKVLRELDAVPEGEPLTIRINSEGGDVLAFNEVANRLRGRAGVRIELGATCFSEAANLVLLSGVEEVYAHPSTIMLFHSAMTPYLEDAAAGELRTEAAMIDRINAPVMAELARRGIPADRINAGFADRGALVLGFNELLSYGIIQGAVFDDDDRGGAEEVQAARPLLADRLAALATTYQRLAAIRGRKEADMAKTKKAAKADRTEDLEAIKKAVNPKAEDEVTEGTEGAEETPAEGAAGEGGDGEDAGTETQPGTLGDDNTDPKKKKVEKVETVEEKVEETEGGENVEDDGVGRLVETVEKLVERIDTLSARCDDLEKRLKEKNVEVASVREALKAERSRRIGAIAKAVVQSASNDSTPADWPAAVAACNGDRLKAYQRFPGLAKAWANHKN